MPVSEHTITAADIISDEAFGAERTARRQALLPIKKLRRIEVGPVSMFYFENYDTMLQQIQEMLLIEGGGAAQLTDELRAYNPLIPQGDELIATVMFEINDEARRMELLLRLGRVEHHMFIEVDGERVMGVPTDDIERTTEDGKTSSVHFIRFGFTDAQKAKIRDPKAKILVGIDHDAYAHMAVISPATRAELAKDFD